MTSTLRKNLILAFKINFMQDGKQTFKRELGLLNATSLVAGSMIGSGIFIVTAQMARDVGSAAWLLIIWLVNQAFLSHFPMDLEWLKVSFGL